MSGLKMNLINKMKISNIRLKKSEIIRQGIKEVCNRLNIQE